MTISIDHLSTEELKDLLSNVEKEISRRERVERRENIKKVEELAKELGLTVSIEDGSSSSGPRRKAKIKYRHPNDSSLTWAGRGRKPHWVQDWLSKGGTLEQIEV